MSRLREIHEYLKRRGVNEETLKQMDHHSVYLSMEIMEYAHRNQKRENGEKYSSHPTRCMEHYRNLVAGTSSDDFNVDPERLEEYGIPFEGVQETCLLHDVIEDTDFSIEEVEEIFKECGLGTYFKLHIKDALERITHDKSVDYPTYIVICMQNPVSAIAKMMDLQDNSYTFSLCELNEKSLERTQNYLNYIYCINKRFKFIENANSYRKENK